MSGRSPTCRAHHAEQGRPIQQTVIHGRRTNLPTVVPNRRLPKDRRQNKRNARNRFTASSSCLPPVGPVARRDGGGGHRARELHASNFSEYCITPAATFQTATVRECRSRWLIGTKHLTTPWMPRP